MQSEGCLGDHKAEQQGARASVLAAAHRERLEQEHHTEESASRAKAAAGQRATKLKEAEHERLAAEAAKAASKQEIAVYPPVLALMDSCSRRARGSMHVHQVGLICRARIAVFAVMGHIGDRYGVTNRTPAAERSEPCSTRKRS